MVSTDKHPQQALHAASLVSSGNRDAGESFWLHAARQLKWFKPPTRAHTKSEDGTDAWFADGRLNTCHECLDVHVEAGLGDKVALRHVSPLEPASACARRDVTYRELLDEVKTVAGVLRHRFGVKKGDRVIIYMPMVPETAVAMLACARIGAVHSVVFGGFAAKEVAKRIDDSEAVMVICGSCGLEPKGVIDYHPIITESFEAAQRGRLPLLLFGRHRIQGHQVPQLDVAKDEYHWQPECERVKREGKEVDNSVACASTDLLYILYTSGTTGMPKGVVRQHGGHAVASRYSIENTLGMTKDDTMLCASDFGWVVGHSYTLYAPLLLGCTSIVFEGKPILPDAGIIWRIVQDCRVTCIYTAPTALRAIQKEDRDAKMMASYDLRSLRALFVAGERSEPSIISRYQQLLGKLAAPGALVVDQYWSTEIGSPITACMLNKTFAPKLPRPGSAGAPLVGMDVRIVDDEGKQLADGEMGNIVLARPLPPSALTTVWRNPARFYEAYFERFQGKGDYFDTGDSGLVQDGYVSVLSRADDLINVAGHRLGTSLLEQVVASQPLIAECSVVGLPDEMKGHVPFAIVIRASSQEAQSADLEKLLVKVNEQVRTDVGSVATLGGVVACSKLPKTRSGKTLRRTLRTLVENAASGKYDIEAPYPPTIEDAGAVEDARKAINTYFKAHKPRAKL